MPCSFQRKSYPVKREGKFLLAAIIICGISNHKVLWSIHNIQKRPTLPLRNLSSVCEDLAKYRSKIVFPLSTQQTKMLYCKVQLTSHKLYWCQYHTYPEISLTDLIFNAHPTPLQNTDTHTQLNYISFLSRTSYVTCRNNARSLVKKWLWISRWRQKSIKLGPFSHGNLWNHPGCTPMKPALLLSVSHTCQAHSHPRALALAILSAWKALLMAKVSAKTRPPQSGLSLQPLSKEAPSFITLWILLCFLSNTLLCYFLANLLIDLFMVSFSSTGMYTPQ